MDALERLISLIRNNSGGFKIGRKTLLGWFPTFDEFNRPLNADPNTTIGDVTIEGRRYIYTNQYWETRIWVDEKKGEPFVIVDDTPDYLKPKPEDLLSEIETKGEEVVKDKLMKILDGYTTTSSMSNIIGKLLDVQTYLFEIINTCEPEMNERNLFVMDEVNKLYDEINKIIK